MQVRPLASAVQVQQADQQRERQARFGDDAPGRVALPSQQAQAGPHTATMTMTGTTYEISRDLPDTYDEAGYTGGSAALSFEFIDRVITFTPYGAERDVQKIKPIASPVEKIKGQADYGDGDMTMSYMPYDPGQLLVQEAESSPDHWTMRVTYPDGEIHYLDVIVSGFKYPGAKEAEAFIATAKIGVCRAPVIIGAV
jgi:hypothetical protein